MANEPVKTALVVLLLVLINIRLGLFGVFEVPLQPSIYHPEGIVSSGTNIVTINGSSTDTSENPYWQYGRYQYQFDPPHSDPLINNRKNLYLIEHETPAWIGRKRISDLFEHSPRTELQANRSHTNLDYEIDTWVLSQPLLHATRNHDTIILERTHHSRTNRVRAISLLGRHNRHVMELDLMTGAQRAVRTRNKTDPTGYPLDDLNHVSAVLVDDDIWLPCGFHNDRVNSEVSTSYARIVNTRTLQVRLGPQLPIAGGACVATSIPVLENEPAMVCSFGGTQGTHDRGKFLRETFCYDRVRHKYWSPFGHLPYGLDHGSLVVIPAGVCHASDPSRVLILNFRTKPYGDAHPEMLAFDMPQFWTLEELQRPPTLNRWYVYFNVTSGDDLNYRPQDVGRDASGIFLVQGRHVVNVGGTYHYYDKKSKRRRGRFSMIRAFDVCRKQWSIIGDLGVQTFALQTAVSEDLQIALTCGGEVPLKNSNSPWCFVNRFHNGMRLSNRYPGERARVKYKVPRAM